MNTLAGDLRVGDIIDLKEGNDSLFRITDVSHVKPGKGGAFAQIVCQHILKHQKKEIKFRTDEKVEKIDIFEKKGTFLYESGNVYVFIDKETFDEYSVENPLRKEFFTEGCDVLLVITQDDNLLYVKLPKVINCVVSMTNGHIPGQSASAQEKPATLTNGIVVKVPQYIKDGDEIRIDSETLDFVGKA